MIRNALPSGIHDLFKIARTMRDGLRTHGPWLNLGAATAEKFGPLLEELSVAEPEFAVARSAKGAAGARVVAGDEVLTAWLAKARLVMMLAVGAQWSPAWIEAGFPAGGTNVPKRGDDRLAVARALVAFLRRWAEYEVVFAGVTAARGESLIAECDAARDGFREASAEAARCKQRRDAAETALRRAMRLVIVCVNFSLRGSDPRWQAFGLNAPRPHAPCRGATRVTLSPAAVMELGGAPEPEMRRAAA